MAPDKVTGMFASPQDQLKRVHKWNARGRSKWVFPAEAFRELEATVPKIPDDQLNNPLVAVVLDIRLETLESTIETAWNMLQDNLATPIQKAEWLKTDPDHLRLHSPRKFEQGLKWRVVDLGANRDLRPIRVQESIPRQDLLGTEILWCAALHPFWLQAIDGEKIPFVVAAGCQMKGPSPNYKWDFALGIWKEPRGGDIHILPTAADCRNPQWAVPVLVEPT